MVTISGNCTPRVSIDLDLDENPPGLPVLWIKTGYAHGVSCPCDKAAVEQLVRELQKMLAAM